MLYTYIVVILLTTMLYTYLVVISLTAINAMLCVYCRYFIYDNIHNVMLTVHI